MGARAAGAAGALRRRCARAHRGGPGPAGLLRLRGDRLTAVASSWSRTAPFVQVIELLPLAAAPAAERDAWGACVATLAAWPAGEPTRPSLTRVLYRTRGTGP